MDMAGRCARPPGKEKSAARAAPAALHTDTVWKDRLLLLLSHRFAIGVTHLVGFVIVGFAIGVTHLVGFVIVG